ncbi:hypothetical protein PMI35_05277 [Pseudomonas sp. GM78]|nr:hypothetical protein PMI35_05277 [Pseudomonas sp. GM78]
MYSDNKQGFQWAAIQPNSTQKARVNPLTAPNLERGDQ